MASNNNNNNNNASPPVEVSLDVVDPAKVTPTVLAQHMSVANYAHYLRAHPAHLSATLDEVYRIFPLRSDKYHPLCKWVTDVVHAVDRGQALQTAFTAGASSVCGKQFSGREMAFKCLECGADPTCIMCAECFKTSPCRDHEFRMVRSVNGMCDCGDPTAWKAESFCAAHRADTASQDPLESIPEDVVAWVWPTHRAIIRFVVGVLEGYLEGRLDNSNNKTATTAAAESAGGKKKAESSNSNSSSIDTFNGTLLAMIGKRLVEFVKLGDAAKRVVAVVLAEPLPSGWERTITLPPKKEGAKKEDGSPDLGESMKSALDVLVDAECNATIRGSSCWGDLVHVVRLCVSDAYMKLPMTQALLLKRENGVRTFKLREASRRSTDTDESRDLFSLGVQVFTVPPVVQALLHPFRLSLSATPAAISTATSLLDRMLSATVYAVTRLCSAQTNRGRLLRLAVKENGRTELPVYSASELLIELNYALTACPDARALFATSPSFLAAFAVILQTITNSCWITRDGNRPEAFGSWDLDIFALRVTRQLEKEWRRWFTTNSETAPFSLMSTPELLQSVPVKVQAPTWLTGELGASYRFLAEQLERTATLQRSLIPPTIDVAATTTTHVAETTDNNNNNDEHHHDRLRSPMEEAKESLLTGIIEIFSRFASEGLALRRLDRCRDLLASSDEDTACPVTFVIPSIRVLATALTSIFDTAHCQGLPGVALAALRRELAKPLPALPSSRATGSTTNANDDSDDTGGSDDDSDDDAEDHNSDFTPSGLYYVDAITSQFAVLSQVQSELWRRNYMKLTHHAALYQDFERGPRQEQDVAMLQLLCTLIQDPKTLGVNTFSLRVFSWFAYVPQDDRLERQKCPFGFGDFLRLSLTIVLDNAQLQDHGSGRAAHDTAAAKARQILCLEQPSGMQRSKFQKALKDACSAAMDEDDEDATEMAMHAKIVEEVAAVTSRANGQWLKLKNTEQYPLLNLYSCFFDVEKRDVVVKSFLEEMQRAKLALTVANSPWPSIKRSMLHPVIRSGTRALLHSEAFQNITLFSLLCAAYHTDSNSSPSAASSSPATANNNKSNTSSTIVPTVEAATLFTALDALLCILEDCEMLTEEAHNRNSLFAEQHVDPQHVASHLPSHTSPSVDVPLPLDAEPTTTTTATHSVNENNRSASPRPVVDLDQLSTTVCPQLHWVHVSHPRTLKSFPSVDVRGPLLWKQIHAEATFVVWAKISDTCLSVTDA